jgi:hypothetical protein
VPTSVIDLKALVISPDANTSDSFVQAFRGLNVIAEVRADQPSAFKRFSEAKFEAVVVDLDNILEPIPFVQDIRLGHANRNAVVVAVATSDVARKSASEHGASFVVPRPVLASQLTPMLRAAYGLMLQDRRRYFRLATELAVSIRTSSNVEFQGKTINVSSEGLALHTPRPMRVGEIVGLVFAIFSPGPLMIVEGTVIWDDKHGKSGVHLHFANSQDRDRISEWLDSEFYGQGNTKHR